MKDKKRHAKKSTMKTEGSDYENHNKREEDPYTKSESLNGFFPKFLSWHLYLESIVWYNQSCHLEPLQGPYCCLWDEISLHRTWKEKWKKYERFVENLLNMEDVTCYALISFWYDFVIINDTWCRTIMIAKKLGRQTQHLSYKSFFTFLVGIFKHIQ